MDWLDIAEKVALPIATLVAGWFAHVFFDRKHQQNEARKTHTDQLKNNVILPLLKQFEIYYLPLINKERSNIIETTEKVIVDSAPLGTYGANYRQVLALETINDIVEQLKMNSRMPEVDGHPATTELLNPVEELYSDLRQNHETELINDLEMFSSDFAKYNASCLRYVVEIRNNLIEEIGLPEMDYMNQAPGINANAFALFIWKRHSNIGVSDSHISGDDNNIQIYAEHKIVARGSKQQIEKCQKIIDRILADKEKAVALLNLATDMDLGKRTLDLKQRLSILSFHNSVSGNCEYLKI